MRTSLWLLLSVLALPPSGTAQQTSPDIADIAAHAGLVFRGTVVAMIREEPRAPDELKVIRVTFRVEDGIRGVASGETLTIRQWSAVPGEYRVGERLVLFLFAASGHLGLTSPVGGRAGHRRVEEVSAEFLDTLRTRQTAPEPVAPATPRPSRRARQ